MVVSISTALCSLVTLYLLSSHAGVAVVEPLHFMGYWPPGLVDSARALLLTALLFAGPLYESLFIDGAFQQWLHLEPLKELWADWPTWRNMVAVSFPQAILNFCCCRPSCLHPVLSNHLYPSPTPTHIFTSASALTPFLTSYTPLLAFSFVSQIPLTSLLIIS